MENNITFQAGDEVQSRGYCVRIVADHAIFSCESADSVTLPFTRRRMHCRVWDIVDYSESEDGSHVCTCDSLASAKVMLRDIIRA